MPHGDDRQLAVGQTGNDHPRARNAGQRDSRVAHEAVTVCCQEFA